ncbi:hypothetical protein M5689_003574 [Euphorbia peplus]|nr:hypothetical protein M5689_003574 [Euphorbia peplus]
MASFCSFLATFMIFMAFLSQPFASKTHVKLSTISAAPALMPQPPLSSYSPNPSPFLSPDIQPVFPTDGAYVPSPSDTSFPTIPSTPSPPNPDVIQSAAHAPSFSISPSGSLPASSAMAFPPPTATFSFSLLFLGFIASLLY